MTLFIIGLATMVAALAFAAVNRSENPRLATVIMLSSWVWPAAGLILGSMVHVPDNQTGVVTRHIGKPLPSGAIVARDGEQGPQARYLGPGWHFGFIPFLSSVDLQPVAVIEAGKVGVVVARDGEPLPPGETFAQAWPTAGEMLDPDVFLTKGGKRGPQLTVLPPGTYRYNPVLHQITQIEALSVAPGTVAVLKANTGRITTPAANGGAALVGDGERGILKVPLSPGAYYLNTKAFEVTTVRTSVRVYTYSAQTNRPVTAKGKNQQTIDADWSVSVRSKDGFTFPVDVRVSCTVLPENAPLLVATLGTPDAVVHDAQENEDLEVLEARVILPSIRAIFRNVAEDMNALDFVAKRSEVQDHATKRMRDELSRNKVTLHEVFIGNIHLDATEAGRKLLSTITDREVALNQERLYDQQRQAEEKRAQLVRATTEADRQKELAQAAYEIQIKENLAKAAVAQAKGSAEARIAEAKGEAESKLVNADAEAKAKILTGEAQAKAYSAVVGSLGRDQVAAIELMRLVAEGKVAVVPQVAVGQGGMLEALIGRMLANPQAVPTPAAGGR